MQSDVCGHLVLALRVETNPETAGGLLEEFPQLMEIWTAVGKEKVKGWDICASQPCGGAGID